MYQLRLYRVYLQQVMILHSLESYTIFLLEGPLLEVQILALSCVPPLHDTEHTPQRLQELQVVTAEPSSAPENTNQIYKTQIKT